MAWNLEIAVRDETPLFHEDVWLEMRQIGYHIGSLTLPHIVAYGEDGNMIRALGFNRAGMEPDFIENGFIVTGSGHVPRLAESRATGPVLIFGLNHTERERWTLTVTEKE